MVGDFGSTTDGTPDRGVAEWVVEADAGSAMPVVVSHPRAGVARVTVNLG
jgi:hypothetical protein